MSKKSWLSVMVMTGLACWGSSVVKAHDGEDDKAEIGKKAPDFTLKSAKGEEVTLSSLKGKIVVLEWTSHQCPFVKRHHLKSPTMRRVKAVLGPEDSVWLAIDSSYFCEEKVAEIRGFCEEAKIDHSYLLDPTGKVGKMYDAKTTPHMFVIDREGVLVYSGAIDDDKAGEKSMSESRNYVEEAGMALINGTEIKMSKTDPYGCSVKYKE